MQVLIVEDETDLAVSVAEFLEVHGHAVDHAADGLTALHLLSHNRYDCVVLDLGLPGVDGLEICSHARQVARIDTPILMLTARDVLEDRLTGFRCGADDYLVKPFALAELEARVRALHGRPHQLGAGAVLRIADLCFDTQTLHITRAGQALRLKRASARILEMLMRESHRVVPREEIERMLWGESRPDSDVLRTHVHAIRLAVDRPFDVALVHTVTGVGYRLCEPADV